MKLVKYISRPFPINEQNQAHWRLPLPHPEQCRPTTQYISNDCVDELDFMIGNTTVKHQTNELQKNLSTEYLQAVGLGKEIRYDLASITVKFRLLQYKDQPTPVLSFTYNERAALHSAIKQIVMAAEILRAVCAGNSDHKYAKLKTFIDTAHFIIYFDANHQKCEVPLGWLQRNIYKIHARLTNYNNIITFIDARGDDVIKMAALQPHLSPYNELFQLQEKKNYWTGMYYNNTTDDTFTEKSSLHYTPAGIRINVLQSVAENLLTDLTWSSRTFSHYILADIIGIGCHLSLYKAFSLAIQLSKDN